MSQSDRLKAKSQTYNSLTMALIAALEENKGRDDILEPTLPFFHLEQEEQRIAMAVCKLTGIMTLAKWDDLDEIQREPWIEEALEKLKEDADSEGTLDDQRSKQPAPASDVATINRTPGKSKQRPKRPAHRPPDTDANQDAKIADQWNAWREKGNPRSIVLFARTFGHNEDETRDALERVRSRRKKSVKRI